MKRSGNQFTLRLPQSNLAPKTIGAFSRQELSDYYNAYILSNMQTMDQMNQIVPTALLIFADRKGTKEPFFHALDLGIPIKEGIARLIKEADVKDYTLELMMYSQEGVDDADEAPIVAFAAKDASGATIHTGFRKIEDALGKMSLEEILPIGENEGAPLHIWQPNDGKQVADPMLDLITQEYAIENSMNNLFK